MTRPSRPAETLPHDERGRCHYADLSPGGKAFWQERAAIREHDGGQTREAAELGAWHDLASYQGAK